MLQKFRTLLPRYCIAVAAWVALPLGCLYGPSNIGSRKWRALNAQLSTIIFLSLLTLLAGCGKPKTPEASTPTPDATLNAQLSTPVLRFHWLGKKRLATEANATNFMAIWNLPESARLEAQTLDKLATAPWRLWQTNVAVSNAPTALFRPLLDDLVQEEVYLEAIGGSNQPSQLVLAIRLPADRAALWETNLPQILTSLSAGGEGRGEVAAPKTFNLQLSTFNSQLTLTRSNGWTLLSFSTPSPLRGEGRGEVSQTNVSSTLLASFLSRLAASPNPHLPRTTNYWVELEANAQKLGESFELDWQLPASFPNVALQMTGDGTNVRTRGEFVFSKLNMTNLPPWDLPFNLTVEPLIGFTVIRSYKPLLEQMGVLGNEQTRHFPEQFMSWLRSGPPLQMYFAYPFEGDAQTFTTFASPIVQWINAHTDARRYGSVAYDPTNQHYKWGGLQLCAPFLRLAITESNSFVHGGFGISPMVRPRIPQELHDHVLQATNLLYFDWEHTHDTLPQWRYFDDVSRMIFDAAHASRLRTGRAVISWFQANLALTNFSHAVTEVRLESSNQLTLTRRSTVGLSALELDILANWIELAEFPAGMSSLWRTNSTPFLRSRNKSEYGPE